MRARSAADVLTAAQPLSFAPGMGQGFNASPNYGSSILPAEPAGALSAGDWNWAPILLGSNHDEMAFFLPALLLAARIKLPLSTDAYRVVTTATFGTFAPAVLNEYPLDRYGDPFHALADELTDYMPLGCPVSTLADTFAGIGTIFRYEFNDAAAPGGMAGLNMGAYHGSELQYLFAVDRLPGPQTGAQRQLSGQMMRYWANFAATGNPNGPGLPQWPRYDRASRRMLSLEPDGPVAIDNFDQDHHCSFWAAAPGPPFR
jgi:para-nitrobenzyl esterase